MATKTAAKGEKRQHPRFKLGMTLDLHSKGGQTTKGLVGSIVDLSVSGMSFETQAELEEGASVYLKVNLPLEIRGQVRRIEKVGGRTRYGVRFHKIDFGGFGLPEAEGRPDKFIDARVNKAR